MIKESHLRALRALVQPLASSQAIGSKPHLVVWSDVRDGLEDLLRDCDTGRQEKHSDIRVKIYLDPDLEARKKSGSGAKKRKRGPRRDSTASPKAEAQGETSVHS